MKAAGIVVFLCAFLCSNGGGRAEPRDHDGGGLQQQHPERRAGGEEAAGAGAQTGAAERAAAHPSRRRRILPPQPAAHPAVPLVLGLVLCPRGAFRLFPPAQRQGWSGCCCEGGGRRGGGRIRAVGSGRAGASGFEFPELLRGV